jgi:uncharacterized protein (TIGR02118 family)
VLYEKGTEFNMDYYLKTHMPLVQENWGPYGLKSWKVRHAHMSTAWSLPDLSADNAKVLKFDEDSPYLVQATLEWGSLDDFKKAAGSDSTKKVMDDVKNFANTSPKLMSGEIVGSQ